jgi:hypothetical protein
MADARRLRLAAAALLTGLLAAGRPAAAAPEKPASEKAGKPHPETAKPENDKTEGEKAEGQAAKVDGFRSATFGMTEAQLRAAIRKDFGLAGDKVAVEENRTQRTTALTIVVNDLLPDAGPARVSYILGFKSKRLFQVNILWGGGAGPEVDPEKLNAAAATLRDYFLGAGYARDTVVVNAQANDGSLIWFTGADASKRTTILRTLPLPPAKEGDKPGAGLFLSYIQDPQNPDIFRIAKGQF